MLRVDILTLFPSMFEGAFNDSIIKRAITKKLIRVSVHNLRDWSKDRHKKVDDKPYGGGPGMVLSCQPIFDAVKELRKRAKGQRPRVILMSAQGKTFDQRIAEKLAKKRHLIFICGHYEGVDARVSRIVTDEISIGNYVLTGGEIPAMAITDAVSRLVPGVLGNSESVLNESFQQGMLEYPQYTRPRVYMGLKVPPVLLKGDHKKIEAWRNKEALNRTRKAGSKS